MKSTLEEEDTASGSITQKNIKSWGFAALFRGRMTQWCHATLGIPRRRCSGDRITHQGNIIGRRLPGPSGPKSAWKKQGKEPREGGCHGLRAKSPQSGSIGALKRLSPRAHREVEGLPAALGHCSTKSPRVPRGSIETFLVDVGYRRRRERRHH